MAKEINLAKESNPNQSTVVGIGGHRPISAKRSGNANR